MKGSFIMEKEEKRIPIELTEENIEKYCYFITEEKNGKKYSVRFYPIYLYEKGEYIYGIFTDFKSESKSNNLSIINASHLKKYSEKFTIKYKLPDSEVEFLEKQKEVSETKEIIQRYKRLRSRIYKDYDSILKLNQKVIETENYEKLKEYKKDYENIINNLDHYNPLKLQILKNWNISREQLKESINLATNKIDAVANREKNKIKCFIGTIIIVIIAIFLIIVLSNDSSESNNYTEDAWCRTYTNAYQKCHYSYWEKRCVCNQR